MVRVAICAAWETGRVAGGLRFDQTFELNGRKNFTKKVEGGLLPDFAVLLVFLRGVAGKMRVRCGHSVVISW